MKDYHVLSIEGDPMSAPVVDHGVMLDVKNVAWAEKQMWDNDVVEKDGSTILFSLRKTIMAYSISGLPLPISLKDPSLPILIPFVVPTA